MSYEDKGTTGSTVVVSILPDRSGHFVCDGAADNIEIQAALDYVESAFGAGEVIVKPGNQYYLDAKIEVPSYTIFRALSSPRFGGTATRMRLTAGVNDDIIGNKAGATKVEIRNFDIWGNRANQVNGHGINIDAVDSIIEGNYVNDIKQNGINNTAQLAKIKNNRFQNIDGNGINSTGSDVWISFNDGAASGVGIYVNGANTEIIGNRCHSCGAEGIYTFTGGDYCTISENRCNDNTTAGIRVTGQWSVVSNNRVLNNTTHGIHLNVSDVVCVGNHSYSNDQYGIYLTGNAHRCTCDGNVVKENGRHGVVIEDFEYSTITGNTIMNNGQDGAYSGMWFYGNVSCKYNVISSNTISDDQTGVETQQNGILMNNQVNIEQNIIVDNVIRNNQVYGISILAGPVSNIFKNNILTGNGTGAINDLGTNTELHEVLGEFNQYGGGSAGLTAPVINTSPGGIDIDANDEFAATRFTLPEETQQVIRIVIWAYTNVLEADAMRLRIVAHGATDNEAWSGNAIDVPDHPSESTNFAANDVIYWVIDASDDAQVGTLAASDYVELMAVGEAAGGADAATDALFGGFEIHYV